MNRSFDVDVDGDAHLVFAAIMIFCFGCHGLSGKKNVKSLIIQLLSSKMMSYILCTTRVQRSHPAVFEPQTTHPKSPTCIIVTPSSLFSRFFDRINSSVRPDKVPASSAFPYFVPKRSHLSQILPFFLSHSYTTRGPSSRYLRPASSPSFLSAKSLRVALYSPCSSHANRSSLQ